MNKVELIGNLTREPEIRTTPGGTSVVSFSLAVQRNYKNKNGERDADFINCIGWRSVADVLGRYCHKGDKIAVIGEITTRSYDKDGHKVYVTEVNASEIEMLGGRREVKPEETPKVRPQVDGLEDMPDIQGDFLGAEMGTLLTDDRSELPF